MLLVRRNVMFTVRSDPLPLSLEKHLPSRVIEHSLVMEEHIRTLTNSFVPVEDARCSGALLRADALELDLVMRVGVVLAGVERPRLRMLLAGGTGAGGGVRSS